MLAIPRRDGLYFPIFIPSLSSLIVRALHHEGEFLQGHVNHCILGCHRHQISLLARLSIIRHHAAHLFDMRLDL